MQLIDALKMVHEAGYCYNDLKLDNIMIGDATNIPNAHHQLHKIRIIDFGLVHRIKESNGYHVKRNKVKHFQGNMIFASKNAFRLKTLGRRDDLISLYYIMLYLLDGDLPFFVIDSNDGQDDVSQDFEKMRKVKKMITPIEICKESEESRRLIPFVQEVDGLRFQDEPNYQKLKFMLVKVLLDQNETPD